MLGSIGPTELILILLIVIIIFGARKLPDLGKSIGEGIKNFKKSMSTKDDDTPRSPSPRQLTAPPPARAGTSIRSAPENAL